MNFGIVHPYPTKRIMPSFEQYSEMAIEQLKRLNIAYEILTDGSIKANGKLMTIEMQKQAYEN